MSVAMIWLKTIGTHVKLSTSNNKFEVYRSSCEHTVNNRDDCRTCPTSVLLVCGFTTQQISKLGFIALLTLSQFDWQIFVTDFQWNFNMKHSTLKFIAYSFILALTGCVASKTFKLPARTNILTYRVNPLYNEQRELLGSNVPQVSQSICYNDPRSIDEEFCHELKFTFLDSSIAKTKKTLDLSVDTNVVKWEYGVYSTWKWGSTNKLTGEIEILEWNSKRIKLREDLIVSDSEGNMTNVLEGVRQFTRKKKR